MEIELHSSTFNGYIPNYSIIMSSSTDHGSAYGAYNYQFPSDNLAWSSPEAFVTQNDLSSSASFYYQSSNLNSTNSDEMHAVSSTEVAVKNKRGRKKGTKKVEQPKGGRRNSKGSESPPNPSVMKKRRLAANARERRRMNGLNTAFDR